MTSTFRSIALVGILVVVAGAHEASAQIDNALEFTTSFQFTVGNTTLPAGSYTITPVEDDPQLLELRGAHASVLFLTESAQPTTLPAKDEVVFSRLGNRHILRNIWTAGSNVGYVTENALGERRLAKHGGTAGESRVAARKTARRTK